MGLSASGRAAIDYARRGWPVFPIFPRDKAPAIDGGFLSATRDTDEISDWWESRPNDNVGIALGQQCGGIVAIDLDIKPEEGIDGSKLLADWESAHGALPETVTAKTGSGGIHMLYRTVEVVRNKVGRGAWRGVDIRGDGGYIVAPPSLHPNGAKYEWVNPPWEFDVADADETVFGFIEAIQTTVAKEGGREPGEPIRLPSGGRYELPETMPKGGRNDGLFRFACKLWASGYTEPEVKAAVIDANERCCVPPLGNVEVGKIIESALSREGGIPYREYKGSGTVGNTAEKQVAEADAVGLDCFKNGVPVPSLLNAVRIIENIDADLKGRFAYSRFDQHVMVAPPLPWDSGSKVRWLTDEDLLHLTVHCEEHHRYGMSGKLEDAVHLVADKHSYDPLVMWLDSLEWDGEPRIISALTRYLGCEFGDYTYQVLLTWMCGAVRRAYEPGAKIDIMPILVGAQGIGKSRFSALLCPREGWFASGYAELDKSKAGMALRGIWIAEMAELLAMKSTKHVEAMKDFITTQVDHYRAPYAHEFVQQPRRCVFIGTTNDPTFLSDKTGNRRFPPLKCGVTEPLDSLWADGVEEDFAQMWAEAVAIYKAGDAPTHLSKDVEAMMAQRQEEFVDEDPRAGKIQEYLDGKLRRLGNAKPVCFDDLRSLGLAVCTTELASDCLRMDHDRVEGNKVLFIELNKIMQHEIAGWVKAPKKRSIAPYGKQGYYIPARFKAADGVISREQTTRNNPEEQLF